MFRIKSDIRKFKCNDAQDVEDLIRNWVIRPSDLVYDKQNKAWSPIGEHETFEPIFAQMAKEASDNPETSLDSEVSEIIEAARSEVSEATEEPVKPKLKIKPFQILKKGPQKSEGPISEGADDDVISSLPMPQAPEGVEPAVVSDEVTIMTERTASLFGLEDEAPKSEPEEAAALPVPQAPEGVEPVAASEEPTHVFAREEDLAQHLSSSSSVAEDDEEDEEPRLRRGDLPEELFLTNEISSPFEAQSDMMDELGHVGEIDSDPSEEKTSVTWKNFASGEPESDMAQDDLRSTDEFSSSSVIIEADYGSREGDDHSEASVADAPEGSALDQVSQASEVSEVSEASEDSVEPTPVAALVAPTEPAGVEPVVPASEEITAISPLEDLLAQDSSAASHASETSEAGSEVSEEMFEAHGLSEVSEDDPFTHFDMDQEELDRAIEANESIYESSEASPLNAPSPSSINEGYAMALPFPIGATDEDIKRGVVPSKLSKAQKDKAFPYPKQKQHMQLQQQRFGGSDISKYAVVVGVVVLLLVLLTFVLLNMN